MVRLETARAMGGSGKHNDTLIPFRFLERVRGGLPLPPWRFPIAAPEEPGGIAVSDRQSLPGHCRPKGS